MVGFSWLFIFYVFQSIAELLISPVGYAMIGRLAPRKYQGIMMGAWMLQTGLGSLFAKDFSTMIPELVRRCPVDESVLFSEDSLRVGHHRRRRYPDRAHSVTAQIKSGCR